MTSSKLCLQAHPSRKTSALFVVLVLTASIGAAGAQEVRLYVTSQAGDRITAKPSLHFSKAGSTGPVFKIDDTTQYQQIVGFGASFLEAGMICINSLDRAAQEHAVVHSVSLPGVNHYSILKRALTI